MYWIIAFTLTLSACSGRAADKSVARGEPEPIQAPVALQATENATLTVATYNIHADRVGDRDTIAAINELDADLVFLQEVSREWVPVLRQQFGNRYREAAFQPYRQRWGGLGILSRLPIIESKLLAPEHGPFPAWWAVIESPLGRIQVLNLHLFPPVRLQRRLGWLGAYRRSQDIHVREIEAFAQALVADMPVLLAGDLNEDASGKAVSWLRQRGFERAIQGFDPTWRWQTRYGPIRWQLDHVLYRGRLRVIAGQVIEAGGSDHLPVIVTFAKAR